jgi:methionyl aminopeptidase
LSAQWEHTILVTDSGAEVLTVSDGMPARPTLAST